MTAPLIKWLQACYTTSSQGTISTESLIYALSNLKLFNSPFSQNTMLNLWNKASSSL